MRNKQTAKLDLMIAGKTVVFMKTHVHPAAIAVFMLGSIACGFSTTL